MTAPTYRVAKWEPGRDVRAFDCGEPAYNQWLLAHAGPSVRSGVCAVYVLVESAGNSERVVGYYAITPAQVVRAEVPHAMARGWPAAVPAWKLGKLAVHVDLRADPHAQWGRHLLRDALERIVRIADAGGGKVIVVDADNAGLVDFYVRNGFKGTGVTGNLSLYLKVSTARKALSR